MLKAREIYLDHFARLGVFTKVLALAGPGDSDDETKKIKEDGVIKIVYLFTIFRNPFLFISILLIIGLLSSFFVFHLVYSTCIS